MKEVDDSNRIHTKKEIRDLYGPTNTFSIDYYSSNDDDNLPLLPHTVLVFIPGNPGLIEWYIDSFCQVLKQLGPGYAVRGVSLSGHGLTEELVSVSDRPPEQKDVAWTIDGQVWHKIAFLDWLEHDFRNLRQKHKPSLDSEPPIRYIFVSHSIGSYFTQKICVLRPDILQKTMLLIHITPFIRMNAPWIKQFAFDALAAAPFMTIRFHESMMKLLASLPEKVVDIANSVTMKDESSRQIATKLMRQPQFARNFFSLGLQEIREVPRFLDLNVMRFIGLHCPIRIIYGDNDHWCTRSQMDELQTFLDAGEVENVDIEFVSNLRHDYVSDPETCVPVVVDFIVQNIWSHCEMRTPELFIRSKL